MFKIATNPLLTTTATAIILGAIAFATSTHAQDATCTTELQVLDKYLQTKKLKPEVMFEVNALRESAIARNAQGDVKGCMQDVQDIKKLMGA